VLASVVLLISAAFRDAATARQGIARASLEKAPKKVWKLENRKWEEGTCSQALPFF